MSDRSKEHVVNPGIAICRKAMCDALRANPDDQIRGQVGLWRVPHGKVCWYGMGLRLFGSCMVHLDDERAIARGVVERALGISFLRAGAMMGLNDGGVSFAALADQLEKAPIENLDDPYNGPVA